MIEYVQLFPTLRCNKNCYFCFNRGLTIPDLPEDRLERAIETLRENKILRVDILGGEPFLYKPFKKLIQLAIECNIETTISTNGSLVDEIEKFINIFMGKKIRIGVSINDEVDCRVLNLVKKHKLWIKSVIKKENGVSKEIFQFAKNNEISYYLIYMDAITAKDLEFSMPFYEFISLVEKLKYTYKNIQPVFCEGFIGCEDYYRCPAGTKKITVMPDGSVYPCYLLSRFERFYLGNIFKNSILEILSSDKLKIFRDYRYNTCNNLSCNFKKHCHGGCVAHSIIHYGTHNKPDPRCKIN